MSRELSAGLLAGMAADAKARAADVHTENRPDGPQPELRQSTVAELPAVCNAGVPDPDPESPRSVAIAAGLSDDDVVFIVEVTYPDDPDGRFIRALFRAKHTPVPKPPGCPRNPFCQWTPTERLDAPGDFRSVQDDRYYVMVPEWGVPGGEPRRWTARPA